MSSLHDQVLAVLDAQPPQDGVVVVTKAGKLLADRPPSPGGFASVVVVDAEPFSYPDPPRKAARRGNWSVIERPAQGAGPGPERDG